MKGLNDSVVKEYYEMMIESAMILGSTISKTDVEKDMMDVLLFETKLSNVSSLFLVILDYLVSLSLDLTSFDIVTHRMCHA